MTRHRASVGHGHRRILRRKRWRDLRRRRPQVIAVALTVFLGVGLYVASYNAYLGLSGSYDATYDRLKFADVWIGGGDAGAIAADVAGMPGVSATERRSSIDVPIRINGSHELVARIFGVPSQERSINQLLQVDGRLPIEAGEPEVSMERHGVVHFDLAVGDAVEVLRGGQWVSARLSGTVVSAEFLWLSRDRSDVVTNPDDFAVLFAPESFVASLGDGVTEQVLVTVADHAPNVIAAVQARALELGATEMYGRDGQPSNATLQEDVTGFAALSFLFPVLFLTVAGMAVSVLLGRMIALQRAEIGMLIANGFSPRTIFAHFTGHGLVIALLGGVPGLVAGLYAGNWMTDAYAAFLDIPVVRHSTSVSTLLVGMGFVVVTGLLAGGLPAWRAARVLPAEAMRPVAPKGGGRRSVFETVLPRRWRTPGAVMVARNLARNPRRSLSTAVGVILAAVLILVALALQDSIDGSIGRQFGEIDRRDITLMLDRTATPDLLAELQADPDVASAEATASVGVAVINPANQHLATVRLDVYRRDTRAHDFRGVSFGDGVLLHRQIARELGVRPGDTVRIATRAGFTAELIVGGVHDETFTALAYLDLDGWAAAGGSKPDAVALSVRSGADVAKVRERLSRRDDVVASIDHGALRTQINQLLGVALMFVAIMVLFGVVMAVALVFNAMSVSLAERQGEVATLQANGVPQPWIRRTITVENLIVACLGIAPGLLVGRVVSAGFLGQFGSEGLSFPLALSTRSYIITVAVLLSSALVAQLPGLRRLGKLDLATTVRERSA